jgi:hypothetical protein
MGERLFLYPELVWRVARMHVHVVQARGPVPDVVAPEAVERAQSDRPAVQVTLYPDAWKIVASEG